MPVSAAASLPPAAAHLQLERQEERERDCGGDAGAVARPLQLDGQRHGGVQQALVLIAAREVLDQALPAGRGRRRLSVLVGWVDLQRQICCRCRCRCRRCAPPPEQPRATPTMMPTL
jgi:hypothetical protein